jgi:hypothetical protein
MEYDMYVFTNRSVYLILKMIVKRYRNKGYIDTYIQCNFYQLETLLACENATSPGALCLWLSTSFWEFDLQ